MWHDRIKDAHPNSEPEYWPSSLKADYMQDEILDLRAALAALDSPADPAPEARRDEALVLESSLRIAVECGAVKSRGREYDPWHDEPGEEPSIKFYASQFEEFLRKLAEGGAHG
jgi:hypothetical protein